MTAGSPAAAMDAFPLKRRKYARQPDPRPALVEAYLYFHDVMDGFFTDVEDGIDAMMAARAQALYNALRRHVLLVQIELQNDDDPQVIFESLNARGEPLLPSDLIRNFAFMRATAQGKDQTELYNTFWREYDERPVTTPGSKAEERFWKRRVRLGGAKQPMLDIFIYHYLQSQMDDEISVGRLYRAFRDWWEGTEERDAEDALLFIRTHSDVFANLVEPKDDFPWAAFARRLKGLDISSVYPILLFLMVSAGDRVDPDALPGIFCDLESYLVRRFVCNLPTKSYVKVFVGLLRRLHAADKIDRGLVSDYLAEGHSSAMVWPDDALFERHWLDRPIYNEVQSSRVALILQALNRQLHGVKQENIQYIGPLSVEHVMPVRWETAWPAPAEVEVVDGHESAIEQRNRVIHTFGNLTLLTQALNSSVSNGPYATKRPEIAQQSLIRINTWFQDAETWDEAAIRTRGRRLFEEALALWPRPPRVDGTVAANPNT